MTSMEYVTQIFLLMLGGLKITLFVFFVVLLLSIPLGFIVTLIGRVKCVIIKWLVNIYITIMRGTPLILQLFFVYYGFPLIPGIGSSFKFTPIEAALIAFVLNYAAYFAEIFRGGLLAIDKGQKEAAQVLGFSKFNTFRYVIIPQMFRICMPALSNETITLVKDTSLLYAIGIYEISYIAKTRVSADASFVPLIISGLLYLLIVLLLTIILRYIEKKLKYTEKTV